MRGRASEPELFPAGPMGSRGRRSEPVEIALVLHAESPIAWLLSDTDDRADAKWAPKSQVTRGEGRDDDVWTMPEWLAIDRGWL